ncbi:MAG: bacteriophage terminase small subunit [Prevotella sp.]|jgi:hypothetical protein|nr:bacteriophage terminase small subunit [Prevotella sp.]
MKYTEKLVKTMINMIETDLFTIAEICESLDISRKTYYQWYENKPEFRKAIEEAKERCEEMLVALARRSLKEKLEGYRIKETKREYEPSPSNPNVSILKKEIIKEKEVAPVMAAIKFVIERNDRKKKEKEDKEIKESKPWIIETTDPELGTVMRQAIERLQTWKKPG